MNQLAAEWTSRESESMTRLQRLARRLVARRLEGVEHGRIVLRDALGELELGSGKGPRAEVEVAKPRAYLSILLGGGVGAAEAYMRGDWTSGDLTAALRILVRNYDAMMALHQGPALLTAPLRRLFHRLHKNTIEGSRRNISAHYDLGNDFFRLFLDDSMMYSCAVFEGADSTLEEASRSKLERICRKLELGPSDHVLEIGTGWGGFAVHAASRYGCRVTTTTISRRQRELAAERVRAAGLSDRVEILLEDYRDLKGRYDKLVSIEMIEAVGHQYFDTYFQKCSDLLAPAGRMLLQAITVRDQCYEQHRRSVDFIKRYIFPGSCLTAVSVIGDCVRRATDLRLLHLEDITPHYARTLREWRKRFLDNIEEVRRMGFSRKFIRMWEFYLSYCEAGFAEAYIGDVQMLFAKPLYRAPEYLSGAALADPDSQTP